MTGYDFHPEARIDLYDIWDFLAEDNPDAADKVANDIVSSIATLVPLPRQGHRRPDLTLRPLRSIRVYDYLIAYAPEEKPLWVVAIVPGSRNPRVIAAILRGRE